MPAELATALAASYLTVVAQDRVPWFALPDVQLIAAQKPHCAAEDPPRTRRRA
jgi:hypothetical protein